MASATTPTNRLTVIERDDLAQARFCTSVTTAVADTAPFETTVVPHDFMSDACRTIDVTVSMDTGDGGVRRLAASELGGEISYRGSLDGYGARELTFSRYGLQSPIQNATLRAPRRVRATGVRGTMGGERRWPLFDGYLRVPEYGHETAAMATITAQDQLLGLARPLFYRLAARSYRSRRSVVQEICAQNRIPFGTFDLPDEGGYIVKEINEGGTRSVGEFLGEWLIPTGAYYFQRNGKLHVRRFSAADASVRTLTLNDIREATVKPPVTDAPNVIRVSSNIYPYTGPDRTGTSVETTEVPFNVALGHVVRVAYEKQDKSTGAITAVSPTASGPLWSKVETTTTRSGNTITYQRVKTWGWKAPLAARQKLSAGGVLSHNDLIDCYHYAHDGSWRTTPTEVFGVISDVETQRWFDASGYLVNELESWSDYRLIEAYRATIANGASAEAGVACYVLPDGRALNGAAEFFAPFEFVQTLHYRDGSQQYTTKGIYASAKGGVVSWREPYPIVPYTPGTVNTGATIYVFGPTSAKRYARTLATAGLFTTEDITILINYVDIGDGTSHSVFTGTAQHPGGYINGTGYGARWAAIINQPSVVATPRPRVEMYTNLQVPEPAYEVVSDRVRLTLNGGVEIQLAIENAWCENAAELVTTGKEAMRAYCPIVNVVTDLDFDLDEGDVITVPAHNRLSNAPVKLLILGQSATLNLETGQNSQTLECRWEPVEHA